ncbi:hypothetical protein V5O48_013638, partial [Marasmius crinis-equi]
MIQMRFEPRLSDQAEASGDQVQSIHEPGTSVYELSAPQGAGSSLRHFPNQTLDAFNPTAFLERYAAPSSNFQRLQAVHDYQKQEDEANEYPTDRDTKPNVSLLATGYNASSSRDGRRNVLPTADTISTFRLSENGDMEQKEEPIRHHNQFKPDPYLPERFSPPVHAPHSHMRVLPTEASSSGGSTHDMGSEHNAYSNAAINSFEGFDRNERGHMQ